jgi:hypothetical protein
MIMIPFESDVRVERILCNRVERFIDQTKIGQVRCSETTENLGDSFRLSVR